MHLMRLSQLTTLACILGCRYVSSSIAVNFVSCSKYIIGWYTTIAREKGTIISTFDKLYGLLPKLLPDNQAFAIQYLQIVWRKVSDIVYSLNAVDVPDNMEGKFKTFVKGEEQRLRDMLDEIKYNVKDMESLYLIIGQGSIEKVRSCIQPFLYFRSLASKHFFPLTRLLLERHLELFQLCKTRVVNDYELRDAADTIEWVYDAVWYRHKDLKGTTTLMLINC